METATLVSWDKARAFGFATPVLGGKDVFIHANAFGNGKGWHPSVGDRVEMEVEVDKRGPRTIRAWVSV